MRATFAQLALVAFFCQLLLASSTAICTTPVYEGLCCNQFATPVQFPSGSGCCYAGQPYPGDTCPAIFSATPTQSPTPPPIICVTRIIDTPNSAVRLGNGNTLITSIGNSRVTEIDPNGRLVWSYGTYNTTGSGGNQLTWPFDANRTGEGTTLIADTDNNRVIEVRNDKSILWQYDGSGLPASSTPRAKVPTSAERLTNRNTLIAYPNSNTVLEVSLQKEVVWSATANGPFQASRLANGNTLIAASQENRVVELNPSRSVVWTYSIDRPTGAERLDNGNTLVTAPYENRVVEVSAAGAIVWQYGTTETSGIGPDQLYLPHRAKHLPNGNTLISDRGNSRVLEVDFGKNIVWSASSYSETDGTTLCPTPTPAGATPTPTPTAPPTPSPSASPLFPPTPEPQNANMVLSIVCPKRVLVSPTETEISAFAILSNGTALCHDRLDVIFPDKTRQAYGTITCEQGHALFLVPIPGRGQYLANATFGGQSVGCSFSAVGSPPRPVDETGFIAIALLSLAAFWISRKKSR